MFGRVTTHQNLLKALLHLKPKYRIALLKICGDEEINCISECVFNVLNGKIQLKEKDRSKLKKHKKQLRILVSKGKSKLRKRVVIQKGGAFLPIILGAVLSNIFNSLSQ